MLTDKVKLAAIHTHDSRSLDELVEIARSAIRDFRERNNRKPQERVKHLSLGLFLEPSAQRTYPRSYID